MQFPRDKSNDVGRKEGRKEAVENEQSFSQENIWDEPINSKRLVISMLLHSADHKLNASWKRFFSEVFQY